MDAQQMNVAGTGGVTFGGQTTVLHLNRREYDCVELYLPKRVSHLSKLYDYLNTRLTERTGARGGALAIEGFSIYEVDGAWRGQQITEERTLVVRILLGRSTEEREESLQYKIMELGRDIVTVAPTEQEILICHYPQSGVSFFP